MKFWAGFQGLFQAKGKRGRIKITKFRQHHIQGAKKRMATLTYLSIIWGSFLSWHTVKYLRLYLLIIFFAKDFILSWFYSWKSKIFWDIAVLVFWKSCKHWGKIDKLFQSGPMLLVDQNISNLAHFKEKCVKKYHFRVVSLSDQKLGHYNYKFSTP